MNLGIDLDGTALRFPEFFSKLTTNWSGRVYVLTARLCMQSAVDDCKENGIHYDEIILCSGFVDNHKSKEIERLGIEVMFDDMPDFSVHFPKSCATFHVRNEDNFDFDTKHYLFTEDTGRILGGRQDCFIPAVFPIMSDTNGKKIG